MPDKVRCRLGPVDQTLHVSDLGVSLGAPVPGLTDMHYPLRLFTPGTELLEHRLVEMIRNASGSAVARRRLGLLLLGTILTPRRVITNRYLRPRDLELVGFGSGIRVTESFARALRNQCPDQNENANIDDEVVRALLLEPVKEDPAVIAAAKELEPRVIEALLGREDLLLLARGVYKPRTKGEAAAIRNAVRAFVERQVPKEVRSVLALRALGAVDAFASDVNEEILNNLPTNTTMAERRTFRILFLKHDAPFRKTSQRYFTGVVMGNKLMVSLLRLVPPQELAHLVLTFLHRAWDQEHADAHQRIAERNLCAILRLGAKLVTFTRMNDRDAKSEKKPIRRSNRASAVPADQPDLVDLRKLFERAGGDAEAAASIAAAESNHHTPGKGAGRPLTERQQQVFEMSLRMTSTEIARELGTTRQSVADVLRAARDNLTGRRRR